MKKSDRTAYEAALHLLGYRAQSEQEMRTKLKRKGYGPNDIEETVVRLYRERYLDDEALAEEIFSLYQESLLYGDRYIQGKLRARGLMLEKHLSAEEETEKARQALRAKETIIPGFRENYRRAAGFLLRRGFSPSVVSLVLDETEDMEET